MKLGATGKKLKLIELIKLLKKEQSKKRNLKQSLFKRIIQLIGQQSLFKIITENATEKKRKEQN